MKKVIFGSIFTSLSLALTVGACLAFNKEDVKKTYAVTYSSTLPTTIKLKDNTSEEIRNYYSALNNLDTSQRRGTNLLKNLKGIIHDDITYYPYGSISSAGVTQIYTITDRDWVNSPVSSISSGTYNSSENKITNYDHSAEKDNNPYIKMLYVDYTRNGPTRFLNGTSASFDKEHVWSQSHGFKASSGATGPAGTDLHHLISGEKAVNQQYHSNWSYGIVKTAEKEASAGAASTISPNFIISGNKLGTALHTHSGDEVTKVFEPNDSDKGRIARALLYMAACYNNYSGHETISDFDPNLQLVDYIIDGGTSVSSSSSSPAKYGILSDLLEWNRTYKPDSFEIHRNNLIYNNYQFNRNPFIDFPEWADFIWGNADSNYQSTGYATPSSDVINDFSDGQTTKTLSSIAVSGQKTSFTVGHTFSFGGIVTATYSDSSTANVTSSSTFSGYNMSNTGNQTVTVSYTEGGVSKTTTYQITVSEAGGGEQTGGSETITMSEQGFTSGGEVSSITGTDCTIAFDKGTNNNTPKYYDTGSAVRLYPNNTMTVSSTSKTIVGITLTFGSGDNSNAITTNVGTFTSPNWTGSANSVTFTIGGTSGHRRIASVKVTYAGSSTPEPTSISAVVDRTYYVGETISDLNITVTDNLGNNIEDFTFDNNNYRFTYSDASSGGNLTNKTFTNAISYDNMTCDLTVQVQRKAHVAPNDMTYSLSVENSDFAEVTATSAGTAGDFLIHKDDITYSVTAAYLYNDMLSLKTDKSEKIDGTQYYATASIFKNDTKFPLPIKNVAYTLGGSYLATIDATIEYSSNGTSGWSTSVSNTSYYFRIRYDGSFRGYVNFSEIIITTYGNENAINVANYIMFEDTNNQCESKYSTAKVYFANLTKSERNIFMNSTDYVIDKGRERFRAWAANQGETITYSDGDYVVSNSKYINNIVNKNTSNTIIFVAIAVSSIIFISFVGYYYLKHKNK